nr:unnamed protein product [Callosobruchus chinensis]
MYKSGNWIIERRLYCNNR